MYTNILHFFKLNKIKTISGWEETGSGNPKKTRLFKTKAQTSTNSPAPSNDARRIEESKPRPPINAAASAFLAKRSVSSPEFQLELVKAAQKRHKERQAKQQAPEVQQKAATEPQNKGSPTPSGPRHAPVGRESSGEHREVKENHRWGFDCAIPFETDVSFYITIFQALKTKIPCCGEKCQKSYCSASAATQDFLLWNGCR